MSKIGVSLKIDVSKLDKSRFFKANSGAVYVDLTVFLDPDNEGQYGDHGIISQSTSKEERDNNVQMPIVGNGKIFYGLQELKAAGNNQAPAQHQGQQQGGFAQQKPAQQGQPRDEQGFTAAQGGFKGQQQAQQQAPKVNPQEPAFDDDIPF